MGEDICPISLEAMENPVKTVCGHVFELEKIKSWVESLENDIPWCPLCRTKLLDFCTQTVPLTVGEPPVLFSINHRLNLKEKSLVNLLYRSSNASALALWMEAKNTMQAAPDELKQYEAYIFPLMTMSEKDKEHLPELMQKYTALAEFHKKQKLRLHQ
jgi:hypothetical protein